MKKVLIGFCFLLALTTVRAQDTGRANADSVIRLDDPTTATQARPQTTISRDTTSRPIPDTSFRYRGDRDSSKSIQVKDSVISLSGDSSVKTNTMMVVRADSTAPASGVPTASVGKSDEAQPKDTATTADRQEETKRELDPRWFISPLLKAGFQDYGMLEKNRKGYLSDANTLPFLQRGNGSFAASAYKNLTQRLSISADLGISFGHVTNNDVLISQTKSKTYNLLDASIYYHLLSPAYRLQPYVTVGIHDLINDASYLTVPLGIGAKFNSRKIMVLGQVTYGQSVSKNNASTTMYSIGIYIPIKSKKYKQLDSLNTGAYNRADAKKKDSTNKGVTNIYITINMDSVLKAKGLLDDNGKPIVRRSGGDDGDDEGDDAASRKNRRKKPFKALGLDDFNNDDYKIDSLDGKPVIRFVVYFEFNEYGLNSKAFGSVDKVIEHLRRSPEFSVVEIKGYTDSVGSNQYNNLLSRKRAKMVLDYMNSRGIPSELLKAKAYGSDDPVADNSDPNQAWLNRRAEIVIHRKELASQ
jgi:outer membrane protein OmpA-like peptidoglycan-associated protein